MVSWRSKKPTAAESLDEAAAAIERLAALVQGGLGVDTARGHLSIDPLDERSGASAMPRAAFAVAKESGAGMAGALFTIGTGLRERARQTRDLETALAGPKATGKLVVALPLLGPVLAFALGLNPIAAMVGSPIGLIATLIGIALLVMAWWWSRRIVAAAARHEHSAGLQLELLAIALRGGMSLRGARTLVAAALQAEGLQAADSDTVSSVGALAEKTGVPVRGLLETEARAARRASVQAGEQRAARAAVMLTVPLGVCVLPSFVLLGVVPFMLSVLAGLSLPL